MKSIDKVIEQISGLRTAIHDLRNEISNRLSTVETCLSMKNETRMMVGNGIFDCTFGLGWIILTSLTSALLAIHFQVLTNIL